jgi:hypothetical protein
VGRQEFTDFCTLTGWAWPWSSQLSGGLRLWTRVWYVRSASFALGHWDKEKGMNDTLVHMIICNHPHYETFLVQTSLKVSHQEHALRKTCLPLLLLFVAHMCFSGLFLPLFLFSFVHCGGLCFMQLFVYMLIWDGQSAPFPLHCSVCLYFLFPTEFKPEKAVREEYSKQMGCPLCIYETFQHQPVSLSRTFQEHHRLNWMALGRLWDLEVQRFSVVKFFQVERKFLLSTLTLNSEVNPGCWFHCMLAAMV